MNIDQQLSANRRDERQMYIDIKLAVLLLPFVLIAVLAFCSNL